MSAKLNTLLSNTTTYRFKLKSTVFLYTPLLYTYLKYPLTNKRAQRALDCSPEKLHFENIIFDPVTYLRNQLERFEHYCKIWTKSNEPFQRKSCLKKLLTDERTDGRTTVNGPTQKLTLSILCSGELKTDIS